MDHDLAVESGAIGAVSGRFQEGILSVSGCSELAVVGGL